MRKLMTITTVSLALAATPAFAQEGLVNVSIPNLEVLGDFISDSDAAALKDSLPMSIQLPVGIAASACGVDAADLAKAKKGSMPSCTASNGSRSLAEAVKKHGGEKK